MFSQCDIDFGMPQIRRAQRRPQTRELGKYLDGFLAEGLSGSVRPQDSHRLRGVAWPTFPAIEATGTQPHPRLISLNSSETSKSKLRSSAAASSALRLPACSRTEASRLR